jgi:hypothetical protein
MSVAAWLSVSVASAVTGVQDRHAFAFSNPNYYAVVAQVIPVLLLTFAVERRLFANPDEENPSFAPVLAFAIVLVNAVLAEGLALVVVGTDHPAAGLRNSATLFSATAICGGLTLIAGQAAINTRTLGRFAVALEQADLIWRHDRKVVIIAGSVLAVLYPVAYVSALFVAGDPTTRRDVVAAVLLLAVALWVRASVLIGRVIATAGRRALRP